MARILFWFIIGLSVWWLLVRPRVSAPSAASGAGRRRNAGTPSPMLQCAYCGVHFPAVDGERDPDGRTFCSAAHHQAALHASHP